MKRTACLMLVSICVAGWSMGCKGPIDRSAEESLRDQMLADYRQRLAQSANGGVVDLTREPSDVEAQLNDERRKELDAMSGAAAYADDPLELGTDLEGSDAVNVVEMTLEDAVKRTIESNLDVRIARLGPAISEEQLLAADAVFDAVLFANAAYGNLDTPQPPGAVPGLSGDQQIESFELTTGIRQPLKTGGSLELSNTITRSESVPSLFGVNSFYDNDITLSATQPLLRGAGPDVNTAQIRLAENALLRDRQALFLELLNRAQEAEAVYWSLALAREQLLIQTRLLDRTIEDRDRLVKRIEFDAAPVQVTEANSFVELRRGDVIRARQAVRDASDQLKRLVNSEALSVAGEALLVPTTEPGEPGVEMSLLDGVASAIAQRPELRTALLTINDATIAQRIADNAKLPLLNVGASAIFNGVDVDDAWDAIGESAEGDYVDFLLQASFEQALGNRAAKAESSAARLQRQQAVLAYKSATQGVVLEVKAAMRTIRTANELIGSTRAARRAAADNLRALQEQEKAGVDLTPEFINLKLQSQERLAGAEIQEIQALIDYNNAITAYHRATGNLLKQRGIVFEEE